MPFGAYCGANFRHPDLLCACNLKKRLQPCSIMQRMRVGSSLGAHGRSVAPALASSIPGSRLGRSAALSATSLRRGPPVQLHSRRCLAQASTESSRAFELDSMDISPYLLWSKAIKLTAFWDAASTTQDYLQHMEAALQLQNADNVQFLELASPTGRKTISLSLTCHPRFKEDMTATMLQMTPATEVQATEAEVCCLPQYNTAVDTQYGSIKVALSLAGNTVYKATPCWRTCQAAADEAGMEDVTAAVVAHAVLQHLQQGLEDGSIDLHLERMV